MPLSTNSLFHFTKNKTALHGILKEGFRLKYCLETIETRKGKIKAAVPMVSFCDIPLSQVKEHILKYGRYGIALSKDWGQTRGLNPVLYIDKPSQIGYNLNFATSKLLEDHFIEDTDSLHKSLADILRYIKNFKGDLVR